MKIGISIPSTVAESDRDTLCEWIQRIDRGPFSRLCTGERIASPFLDIMCVLSAAAVLTDRVPIQSLISLAPLYAAPLLAKQAATVDVLSDGRFTLGVGVGVREYDYILADKPEVFSKRLSALDTQVHAMRSIWAGDYPLPPDAPAIGPKPVQANGPPIYASSLGPKSMQRAVKWADGLAGFNFAPDIKEVDWIFKNFTRLWKEQERRGEPDLQLAFWFGLTNDAPKRLVDFAYNYMLIFGEEFARERSPSCMASSPDAIRELLHRLEDVGCTEVILTPTTADLDELSAAEDLVASL